MEFRILGSLEVIDGDEPLPLGGRRQRALLALLILNANHVVAREQLIDSLWGRHSPATAANAVQVYVSRLRKLLGKEALLTQPPGYLLRVAPEELDLERFERLIAAAASSDPALASKRLRAALSLWRGTPLADLADQELAGAEIQRLEELRAHALEQRIGVDLALGGAAELVPELEALVRQYPLREQLTAHLMLALYRAGRQAESLEAYVVTRRTLVDQIGIEPGRDLHALHQAILRQDPALQLPKSAVQDGSSRGRETAAPAPPERRKLVTCLACDLSELTQRDELRDPEALRAVSSRCLDRLRSVAARHGGTVERFGSEGAMLIFSLDIAHEHDALRAVRSAVEIRAALREIGVEASLGVNTGEVLADAREGRVTGQALSVAVQLGQVAEPGELLLGEATVQLVRDAVVAELVGASGRGPGAAWRLLSLANDAAAGRPSPFVGREAELAAVAAAWERACAGERCELLTVLGTAGIGKSRLIAEFVAELDAMIVRGRCPSYGEGVTYWPVLEVLRQLKPTTDELELDEDTRTSLRGLLESDASVSTDDIAWGFRKLLEAVAGRQPLLVVFDDLQWGETAFLDLVEHVALVAAGAPLMLACMSRPDLLDRRPGWEPLLRLEPFAEPDADRLIAARLGDAQMAPQMRQRILATAGGNPLFIEEMVAMLHEGDGDVAVPPTIQALLAARLDQLEPGERILLERGAVEGEVFHGGGLRALLPDEPRLTSRLTALVRKDLVRPEPPQLRGEDAFRFRHVLLRNAAYAGLPKVARADLHERLADWFGDRGSALENLDEILGFHLEQAHGFAVELALPADRCLELAERAGEHLVSAARRASARGDFSAAASLMLRRLELVPEDGFDPELEFELADVHFFSGRLDAAEALLSSLAERAGARNARQVELRARIYQAITMYYLDPEGRLQEVKARAEEGMPVFTEASDDAGLFAALLALGHVDHACGHHERKREKSERAREAAVRLKNETRVKIITRYLIDSRVAGPTPVAELLQWLDDQERDGMEHPGFVAARAQALAMLGSFEEARTIIQPSRELLAVRGAGVQLAESVVSLSAVELLAGNPVAAERAARESWDMWNQMGNRTWACTAAAQLAKALYALERLDEAKAAAESVRELSVSDDVEMQSLWRQVQAKIAARRDESAEAERLANHAVGLLEPTDALSARADALLDLAETLELNGRSGALALEQALQLFERKGNLVMAERTRAQLSNLRRIAL